MEERFSIHMESPKHQELSLGSEPSPKNIVLMYLTTNCESGNDIQQCKSVKTGRENEKETNEKQSRLNDGNKDKKTLQCSCLENSLKELKNDRIRVDNKKQKLVTEINSL